MVYNTHSMQNEDINMKYDYTSQELRIYFKKKEGYCQIHNEEEGQSASVERDTN